MFFQFENFKARSKLSWKLNVTIKLYNIFVTNSRSIFDDTIILECISPMSTVSKPCNNMIKSAAFLMSFSYFLNKTVTTVNVKMHYFFNSYINVFTVQKQRR